MGGIGVFSFTQGIYSAELPQVVKVQISMRNRKALNGVFLASVWRKANMQICSFFFLIAEK